MSANALTQILAYKREEVTARKAARPLAALEADIAAQPPARGFRAALARDAADGAPALIAEIKKASPSKGLIAEQFDPPAIARAYAAGGASCLSVLTDAPSFQGSEADLQAARAAVALPVLRKDFTVDAYQVAEARAIGADAILVILAAVDDDTAATLLGAARDYGLDVLVEVHDAAEMARAAALGADLVGVNNRDLRTFETRLEVSETLAPLAPKDALMVAESGIFTPDDVMRLQRAGAAAFLVGESLMRAPDPAEAARRLRGAPAST